MKFVKRLIALSLLQTIMLESGKRRLEWKDLLHDAIMLMMPPENSLAQHFFRTEEK